jgi:tetratricopeptide (TPR) repeat protein
MAIPVLSQAKAASDGERREMTKRIKVAAQHAKDSSMREAATTYAEIYEELKKRDFGPEITWSGLNGYGRLLTSVGDLQKAIAVLGEAKVAGKKFNPNALAESTFHRAYAILRAEDIPGAVKEYEAAEELSPTNSEVLLELGAAYRLAKQYEKAHATYEKLLALQPDDARVHGNVGNLWLTEGKLETATAEFEKAATLTDEKEWSAKNFLNVAFRYQQTGQFAKALTVCQRAVELAPDMPLAHADLGISLAGLGRKEEARTELRRALSLSPDDQTRRYIEMAQANLN